MRLKGAILGAALLAGVALGGATAFAQTGQNSANFSHGGCTFTADARFDTAYPVGSADTVVVGSCADAWIHAQGDFWGADSQYHTLYSAWRGTNSYTNSPVFYWAWTNWVWDYSQAEKPAATYSSLVSVLAN